MLKTTCPVHMQKGSEIHRASLGEVASSRPGYPHQKFNYLWLKRVWKKICLDTGWN